MNKDTVAGKIEIVHHDFNMLVADIAKKLNLK